MFLSIIHFTILPIIFKCVFQTFFCISFKKFDQLFYNILLIISFLDLFYKQTTSTIESNLEGLASVLDGDIQNFKKKVLKLLVECAVNMPEKCTIYSTLVGLLNAKNYNFGGEVSDFNIIKYYILIGKFVVVCLIITIQFFFENLVCRKHCTFFQR